MVVVPTDCVKKKAGGLAEKRARRGGMVSDNVLVWSVDQGWDRPWLN